LRALLRTRRRFIAVSIGNRLVVGEPLLNLIAHLLDDLSALPLLNRERQRIRGDGKLRQFLFLLFF